jgi:hypothetical protein
VFRFLKSLAANETTGCTTCFSNLASRSADFGVLPLRAAITGFREGSDPMLLVVVLVAACLFLGCFALLLAGLALAAGREMPASPYAGAASVTSDEWQARRRRDLTRGGRVHGARVATGPVQLALFRVGSVGFHGPNTYSSGF